LSRPTSVRALSRYYDPLSALTDERIGPWAAQLAGVGLVLDQLAGVGLVLDQLAAEDLVVEQLTAEDLVLEAVRIRYDGRCGTGVGQSHAPPMADVPHHHVCPHGRRPGQDEVEPVIPGLPRAA
jgi:hypothetical protein